jgi:L-iditol 2-dehydrogenase
MMTAAVLYGREDVRIEQVPIPPVGPGEVRVRIGAALTCGTDVKVFRRGYHARMIRPPALFGHELAGEIVEVGNGISDRKVGDRVVVANSAPCDACYFCRRGLPELCEDLLFLNGAYAGYITVPERIVRKNMPALPDHVTYTEAALTEPLACAVRGMAESPVRPGDTVAVLGLGPIGLMFVRLCKLAGAHVLAVGRRSSRLALAAELGADELIDIDQEADVVHSVRARTEGARGVDLAIEAVGRPEAWEQAIACVRKAGRVSLFGGCPADTSIRVETHRIHYDEVTLTGTFHHTPDTFRAALNLIATGQVPAQRFISRQAPLADLPSVLSALARGDDAVKFAIDTH